MSVSQLLLVIAAGTVILSKITILTGCHGRRMRYQGRGPADLNTVGDLINKELDSSLDLLDTCAHT